MSDFDPIEEAAREQVEDTDTQLARDRDADAIKWLMADGRGRWFIRRLLERAGIYRTSFSSEALAMSFREGERNLGLSILRQATDYAPEHLVELLTRKDEHG